MQSVTVILTDSSKDYEEKRRKEFCDFLTKIINENILPNFGKDIKTFNIELGLFTSDQYGSYRITFYDKDNNEVCYINADTILGEWTVFKNGKYDTKS